MKPTKNQFKIMLLAVLLVASFLLSSFSQASLTEPVLTDADLSVFASKEFFLNQSPPHSEVTLGAHASVFADGERFLRKDISCTDSETGARFIAGGDGFTRFSHDIYYDTLDLMWTNTFSSGTIACAFVATARGEPRSSQVKEVVFNSEGFAFADIKDFWVSRDESGRFVLHLDAANAKSLGGISVLKLDVDVEEVLENRSEVYEFHLDKEFSVLRSSLHQDFVLEDIPASIEQGSISVYVRLGPNEQMMSSTSLYQDIEGI